MNYGWIKPLLRQLCWNHLKRDFKSLIDYGADARRVGEQSCVRSVECSARGNESDP